MEFPRFDGHNPSCERRVSSCRERGTHTRGSFRMKLGVAGVVAETGEEAAGTKRASLDAAIELRCRLPNDEFFPKASASFVKPCALSALPRSVHSPGSSSRMIYRLSGL